MSIGDCPHWPDCGHKAQSQCDATGPGDARVPGTDDRSVAENVERSQVFPASSNGVAETVPLRQNLAPLKQSPRP